MTPATRNFAIHQGSTDALALVWKRDGVAVDLTGYSARMQLRYSASDAAPVTEFSTVNGKIVLTALGQITVHLDAATTAALAAATYVYDLDVTTGADTRTLIAGTITIGREVTRG